MNNFTVYKNETNAPHYCHLANLQLASL